MFMLVVMMSSLDSADESCCEGDRFKLVEGAGQPPAKELPWRRPARLRGNRVLSSGGVHGSPILPHDDLRTYNETEDDDHSDPEEVDDTRDDITILLHVFCTWSSPFRYTGVFLCVRTTSTSRVTLQTGVHLYTGHLHSSGGIHRRLFQRTDADTTSSMCGEMSTTLRTSIRIW